MNDILKNKSVIISGGTTGIGRATAILLAQSGANVFIFGRHERELNDALTEIKRVNPNSGGIIADVAYLDQTKKVFSSAIEKFGKIDILINNSAIGADGVLNTDEKEMEYVVDVNLLGYLRCAQLALKTMIPTGDGHIINIGSMSAQTRDGNSDIYTATKSGVQGFSESLRKIVNNKGIKVTLIEPGLVGTDLHPIPPEEQVIWEEKMIMLKAEDVAQAVLFSLIQPKRCDVFEIRIKPIFQEI